MKIKDLLKILQPEDLNKRLEIYLQEGRDSPSYFINFENEIFLTDDIELVEGEKFYDFNEEKWHEEEYWNQDEQRWYK